MKVVRSWHEAHHRGYRIEGERKGEGWILRVTPTGVGLSNLPYTRFRTIGASSNWAKAVLDVTRYIDDFLEEGSAVSLEVTPASKKLKAEEIMRLRARLLVELRHLRAKLESALNPPGAARVSRTSSAPKRTQSSRHH
jgi:hypothetical protein